MSHQLHMGRRANEPHHPHIARHQNSQRPPRDTDEHIQRPPTTPTARRTPRRRFAPRPTDDHTTTRSSAAEEEKVRRDDHNTIDDDPPAEEHASWIQPRSATGDTDSHDHDASIDDNNDTIDREWEEIREKLHIRDRLHLGGRADGEPRHENSGQTRYGDHDRPCCHRSGLRSELGGVERRGQKHEGRAQADRLGARRSTQDGLGGGQCQGDGQLDPAVGHVRLERGSAVTTTSRGGTQEAAGTSASKIVAGTSQDQEG